jgi:Na+/H+-translocating membrane pyrophosphatase
MATISVVSALPALPLAVVLVWLFKHVGTMHGFVFGAVIGVIAAEVGVKLGIPLADHVLDIEREGVQ